VLVDFWAEWCGPCRTLGPVLERLANDSQGQMRVAKVDTEVERELAQAFRVQSIPFVVAFVGGRPVDAFAGALPEPEVLKFLERHGVKIAPEAPSDAPPSPLSQARDGLSKRDPAGLAELAGVLEGIEEDEDDYAEAVRLLEAFPWFRGEWAAEDPEAEQAAVASPAESLARQARDQWLAGEDKAAMETLFTALSEDPGWRDELARKALVALMALWGGDPEHVANLRRRLAVLLY